MSWEAVVLLFTLLSPAYSYPSNQPVIGVLLETNLNQHYRQCNAQYRVRANYRAFIEQGGGGVVPVFVNQTDDYYEQLIPRLNGVLLPGGGVDLITSFYGKAAYKIFQMAVKMNDDGVYFPVWGTCLGMEEMTTWPMNPRQNLVTACEGAEGVSLPLNFTAAASKSRLFGGLPSTLKKILSTENVTANYHHRCLSEKAYLTSNISRFYEVLSFNRDTAGMQYVSTFEARDYPFYGVQWHPEKGNYAHPPNITINQSLHTARVSEYFGNFLVEQARMNKNTFKSSKEEVQFFINNYPPYFDNFYEYYCFNDKDVPNFE